MKIKFSRFRILLLTFILGLTTVSVYTTLSGQSEEIPVDVPKVESDTPIIIRLCPDETLTNGKKSKGYWENGYLYFSKEKAINCTISMGAS